MSVREEMKISETKEMKVSVTIMYKGKKSNENLFAENNTSLKDIKKSIECKLNISLKNSKVMYNKRIFQKDDKTLYELSYKEGIPIIIFIRNGKTIQKQINTKKSEEKKVSEPSCEPLVFKQKSGPTAEEILDTKQLYVEQFVSFGVKEDLAWKALDECQGNFEQAYNYIKNHYKGRNERNKLCINKIRNILIEKPYRLELYVQIAEKADTIVGYKSRYNPEEFLRDLHLDPKNFPCDEIRSRSITQEKATELTTLEEIDVRDITEMGFDRDYVKWAYLKNDSDKIKTINYILQCQRYNCYQ